MSIHWIRFSKWISSWPFSAPNSSKGQVRSYGALHKAQHEMSPTDLCNVICSHNSYSTLSTLLPYTLPYSSHNICFLWPTVGNNFLVWAGIHIKYVKFVCGVCVGMYKTKQILTKKPGGILRCFLSYPISFFKMLVATHQIGFILLMGHDPTTWKTLTLWRGSSIYCFICLDYPFPFVYSFWSQLKDHFLRNFPGPPCLRNHHHQTRAESLVWCFIASLLFITVLTKSK